MTKRLISRVILTLWAINCFLIASVQFCNFIENQGSPKEIVIRDKFVEPGIFSSNYFVIDTEGKGYTVDRTDYHNYHMGDKVTVKEYRDTTVTDVFIASYFGLVIVTIITFIVLAIIEFIYFLKLHNMTNLTLRGAHNAMTFLKPKHWWGYLLMPFAKCQNKDLEQMYDSGIRVFDIRVYYKNGSWNFAHGSYALRAITIWGSINLLFNLCAYGTKNSAPGKVIIRLILERDGHEDKFQDLCNNLENWYGHKLTFIGGNRKSDWKQLYDFKHSKDYLEKDILQEVSSMDARAKGIIKILPRVFAKKYTCNRHWGLNADAEGKKIILRDFV